MFSVIWFTVAITTGTAYYQAEASCPRGNALVASGCTVSGGLELDEEPELPNGLRCVAHGKRGRVTAWVVCK